MSRSVPEWIGKNDDSRAPPAVRVRVFLAHGGICHLSKRVIRPGEPWDLDHVKALINGGENRESNLAPALRDKHRAKTAEDVAEKSWVACRRANHIGAKRMGGGFGDRCRKMDGSIGPTKRSLRFSLPRDPVEENGR